MDDEVNGIEAKEAPVKKRSEWEIKEDVRAIKKVIKIFKDRERLSDAKKMIKENSKMEKSMELVGNGDLKGALGL